jgi:predicted nucleic acid-binding protein
LIVLDANILIRAVLGWRVFALLEKYRGSVRFFAPELAFEEADRHIPSITESRNARESRIRSRAGDGTVTLSRLRQFIQIVPESALLLHEEAARKRLKSRDPKDIPILAAVLALNCPIWTEDTDFFGTGVPTWTTDRVEIYLASQSAKD